LNPPRPRRLRPAPAAVLALALASPAVAAAPSAAAAEAAPDAAPPRVVVLGFDGVDADLARRWMDEGRLPHLARLRDAGTFSPLRSTIPSQTPVSWSTFATGLNPGRHQIFDFLKRDTQTYRPTFAAFDEGRAPFLWGARNGPVCGALGGAALALALFAVALLLPSLRRRPRRRRRLTAAALVAVAAGIAGGAGVGLAAARLLPEEVPTTINRRQGDTFWEVLGRAGKRVRVVRVPVTFPPEPYPHGELLAGLGTPDLSLRIGKPFYFTSELFFQPKGGGEGALEVVELAAAEGTIETAIKGPPNQLFPGRGDYVTIPLTLTVAADRSRLGIAVSGRRLDLAPGEWSDWVRFTFPFNALVKVRGIGRFRVLSLDPEVRLYLSPIQFDPERLPPTFAITAPGGFVDELTGRFGLFKTIGWAIDTWSITEGTVDEAVFFEDVDRTVGKFSEMLYGLLGDDDWDVLVHYFEFTDRVQHVMYRHFDPQHPLYTAEGAARWGDSILEAYRKMDSIVGQVTARMPAGAVLLVVSDHGFAPWRWTVNYNHWLAREGYLSLRGEGADRAGLEDLFGQGQFFAHVDWGRTRAYAMGLGDIYVNLAGREGQGIVQPGEEYRRLTAEIKERLEAVVDPATGERPVAHVFTRDEAYGAYDPALIPDLLPANARGYRVGWQDSLGIVARRFIEPNTDVWSGDHCSVYPPLVDGVLFSNRRLDLAEKPYMGDVMPTLLAIYGVPPPVPLDGVSRWPG
jgi:predicted AlkP superfamily phosphohydrolase/phosphomutase